MALHSELNAMHERVFTDELLDSLLSVYHQRMKEENCMAFEEDYAKAQGVMEHSLTDEQKNTLKAIEASWQKVLRQAVPFGFSRGLYAGFQAAFDTGAPKDLFQTLVVDELLTMPNMEHYPENCNDRRKAEIQNIFGDRLSKCLRESFLNNMQVRDRTDIFSSVYAMDLSRDQPLSGHSFYYKTL